MLEKEKIMNKAFDYLGRVTIPKEFRDRLGIEPEDKVRVTCTEGIITLEPVKNYCKICGTKVGEIHEISSDFHICESCMNKVQRYASNRK